MTGMPPSVKQLALHRKLYYDNYGNLWPNRVLMSVSFAESLTREMIGFLRDNGVRMDLPVLRGYDPVPRILVPGTTIFNMRVTIVPDDYIVRPFEVACSQELVLPHDPYMEMKRRRMIGNFSRYETFDFSDAPVSLIES